MNFLCCIIILLFCSQLSRLQPLEIQGSPIKWDIVNLYVRFSIGLYGEKSYKLKVIFCILIVGKLGVEQMENTVGIIYCRIELISATQKNDSVSSLGFNCARLPSLSIFGIVPQLVCSCVKEFLTDIYQSRG